MNTAKEIPRQFRINPYQYQFDGIDFFTLTDGTALLGDDMGLGKTLQSIYWCNKNNKKALVVAPASVLFNWKKEIEKFTYSKCAIIESRALKTKKHAINWHDSKLHYLLISYSFLKFFVKVETKSNRKYATALNTINEIQRLGFDTIIMDEVHYTGNASSIRSKQAMLIGKKMDHKICMSGTPIVNKPIEFFPTLNLLRPNMFPNWKSFAVKYCGWEQGRYGNVFSDSNNLRELSDLIKPFFLRRKKEEVLDQLPSKTRQIISHDLEAHPEYNSIIQEILDAEDDFSRLRGLNKMRMVLAMAMVKHTIDFLKDLLCTDSKIIVGSMFKKTLDLLMEDDISEHCLFYHGKLNKQQKNEVLEEFNYNPKKRILLGTPAITEGLNIQVADKVVVNDPPWTPAKAFQLEDRAYRIGQKNNVNVYYMCYEKTYYEVMFDIINNKNQTIETVLEGNVVTQGNVLEQVIKYLEKQA